MARQIQLSDSLSADMRRYIMFKGGKSAEDIAALENVKKSTVERSIALIQGARSLRTVPEMHLGLIGVVNDAVEPMKRGLQEALAAKVKVQVGSDAEGNPIFEDVTDHDTVLKAVDRVTAIAEAVTPKAKGGIGVFINQPGQSSDQTQEPSMASARGRRFEDILRNIDDRRALPAPVDSSGETIPASEGEIEPASAS